MGQLLLLSLPQEPIFSAKSKTHEFWPKLQKHRPLWFTGECAQSLKCHSVESSSQGTLKLLNHVESSLKNENLACNERESESETLPYVQTLGKFPKKELFDKVVLVRFDSTILLGKEAEKIAQTTANALLTIKYLYEAGAKVILVSDWSVKNKSKTFSSESVADFLSSALNYKVVPLGCISADKLLKIESFEKADILLLDSLSNFKGEVANCPEFSEALSFGVDIFVNDSFSQSHKILASTVGVTRFCYECLAGFHFEENLYQLRNLKETEREPYVAIIGGGNLQDKAAALHFLAYRCEGLVFVGMMAFQIMHALGLPVPLNLMERGALQQALDIVQFVQSRNVELLYPKDFWCKNRRLPMQLEIFPSHAIMDENHVDWSSQIP